jgi:hypothetical protein
MVSTPITAAEPTTAKEVRVNEKKWSKALMNAGWTALPSVSVGLPLGYCCKIF